MSLSTRQVMDRNLALAETHLLNVLDDPRILDGIPENAHVIFLPANDPELLEANLGIANQLARQMGHNGSRKPIVLMLFPAQEDHGASEELLYRLDPEPTFERLRDEDQDATYGQNSQLPNPNPDQD